MMPHTSNRLTVHCTRDQVLTLAPVFTKRDALGNAVLPRWWYALLDAAGENQFVRESNEILRRLRREGIL